MAAEETAREAMSRVLDPSDGDEEEVYYDDLAGGEEDGSSDSEYEVEDEQPQEYVDGVVAVMEFLGRPTRFATFQSTAGFMRLAVAEVAAAGHDCGAGEIVVDYRYTRFSRARSAGDGVDVRNWGPKVHRLRYLVRSPAADPVSSLRLAGASVASLVYPRGFTGQLRAMWLGLLAVATLTIPPRATRLQVTVDVGILRREDRTPARMAHMCAALPALARECDGDASSEEFAFTTRLPAPVRRDDDDDDHKPGDGEERPAKRRKLAVDDNCPICHDELEAGLAAWPQCSHVFHVRCMEELLLRGMDKCPMCREELQVKAPGALQ